VANSNGIFPPIFLSGLYRVELRDKDNVVQPGWPIDNVGQDTIITPFAPWSEIFTYQENDVVTSPLGNWYRSKIDANIGNDPDDNPDDWELIVIPVADNFTSDASWLTWSDSAGQISIDVDIEAMVDQIEDEIEVIPGDLEVGGTLTVNQVAGGNLARTGAPGFTLTARRNSTKSIASSTTLEKDDALSITGLLNGAWYHVQALIAFSGNGSLANGIRVKPAIASGLIGAVSYIGMTAGPTANAAPVSNWSTTNPFAILPSSTASHEPIKIDAYIRVDTGGEVWIEWAQSVSSATATSVARAFISATQLDNV
jgi:hypothetical protein